MEFAEKLRMTHKQDHPDYKYQPRRKKARSLTASAVQCGETTNNCIGSTTATNAGNKSNNVDLQTLRACKKLAGNKSAKSTTALQQASGHKMKINGDIRNNNNKSNNNNAAAAAVGPDMFTNEAFMKSFNNACTASLMQQHMPKDINQIGGIGCEYLQTMDSPNSNASSLHSASMIINYGSSLVDEPPLTPPATPAYTAIGNSSSSNINCATKQTLGRPTTSLLLRQLSNTHNTNTNTIENDLLSLHETTNNTELMSVCNTAYNEASNGASGMEFLEFPGIEYGGASYIPQHLQDNILSNNNRFQSNTHAHGQAYGGYNGITDGGNVGFSAYNLMPCSSTLKMHNYISAGAEVIDAKEIDQYLMDHVLPMTQNEEQQLVTKIATTIATITTNNESSTTTRAKLSSSSSTTSSCSSSSSPTSSSYCSSGSSTASSSLSSPLYKQMSTHMLHELQPAVVDTSTGTGTSASTTTTTPTTINISSYSVGNNNNNNNDTENHAATAFVSVAHPSPAVSVAANGGNYYYSPLHYATDAIISSSTSALTPTTAAAFQHYQQQQLEHEHLCESEPQQHQWENYVSH